MKSDPGQSGISHNSSVPQVEDQDMSEQRTTEKPVVALAISSFETTSEKSSSEIKRNVRIDDTAMTSFKETHIQGKEAQLYKSK